MAKGRIEASLTLLGIVFLDAVAGCQPKTTLVPATRTPWPTAIPTLTLDSLEATSCHRVERIRQTGAEFGSRRLSLSLINPSLIEVTTVAHPKWPNTFRVVVASKKALTVGINAAQVKTVNIAEFPHCEAATVVADSVSEMAPAVFLWQEGNVKEVAKGFPETESLTRRLAELIYFYFLSPLRTPTRAFLP